jgi:hypothetical protein
MLLAVIESVKKIQGNLGNFPEIVTTYFLGKSYASTDLWKTGFPARRS